MLKTKIFILKIFNLIVTLIYNFKIGRTFLYEVINFMINKEKDISHNGVNIRLSIPTRLTYWRAETFSSKEPETLQWIDSFKENETFWDVGANVGLYSIYAAKKSKSEVYCFEPSVFNLELLARNIYINNCTNQIHICPFALSDQNQQSILKLQSKEWGGALSSFNYNIGFDGKELKELFSHNVFGFKIDDLPKKFGLPLPDHIKIDVDGIEHFILRGATALLSKVQSVHIEINDDFYAQSNECNNLLASAGLTLEKKQHSSLIETSEFGSVYNQTWHRKS